MKTYTIDLNSVYNADELHAEIRGVLPVPEFYGNNLDALHDVLTDFHEPCRIEFRNLTEAEITMPKYIRSLKKMCEDVMKENEKVEIVFAG